MLHEATLVIAQQEMNGSGRHEMAKPAAIQAVRRRNSYLRINQESGAPYRTWDLQPHQGRPGHRAGVYSDPAVVAADARKGRTGSQQRQQRGDPMGGAATPP